MKKKIKIGILGLGRAGWSMISPELDKRKEEFEIVAAAELIKERREKFVEKYPGAAVYRNMRDMFKDANVELVVVAGRSCDHMAHTIEALKAGKDVLVEKPMSETYAQAKRMMKTAERLKRRLYVRHNRRFEGGFMHVREIIKSGILGDVFEIKLRRNSYQRRDDWQTLKKYGGGQLLNWGPHIIDHSLRLLESPVKDVWSDLKKVAAAGDAEDHLKIVFRGENGRIVDMEISGGSAITEPEYLVSGTKGALKCSGSEIELRYLDPKKKLAVKKAKEGVPKGFGSEKLPWIEKKIPVKPESAESKKNIWDHLYASIRRGKKFPVDLNDAVEVMKIVSLARKGTRFDK